MDKITSKIEKVLNANFKTPITFNGPVEEKGDNFFVVKGMECHCHTKVDSLEVGDNVRVSGFITFKSFNKIVVRVDIFYIMNPESDDNLKKYSALQTALLNDRCKKIINKFKTRRCPKIIYNIGLLILSNEDPTNFKILFQEKCVGKLFIYRLDSNASLESPIEYFKKYHDIHIICLLADGLTFEDTMKLSSKNNVKYMLNRNKEKCPIIAYVSSSDNQLVPLVSELVNLRMNNINSFLDFVHDIQWEYRNKIEDTIRVGETIILSLIDKYKMQVINLQLCMEEFNESWKGSEINMVRDLIIRRLLKEKMNLCNIQVMIMKRIIADPNLEKLYPAIIEQEEKKDRIIQACQSQERPSQERPPTLKKIEIKSSSLYEDDLDLFSDDDRKF